MILCTAYASIEAIAQQQYRMLPVSWLLKHRFDSLQRAPQIKVPLLELRAGLDRIIPNAESERLVAAWGGPHRSVIIPEADHNNIQSFERYWGAITDFLSSLQ